MQVDEQKGEIALFKPDANQPPRNHYYDYVFGPESRQEDVFNSTSLSIVESVIKGYNGSIFAYGQTGTGKTHTMEGVKDSQEHKGIIPRCFDKIFEIIKSYYNTNFLIRCSYLEIYNESIQDLISKEPRQKLLTN